MLDAYPRDFNVDQQLLVGCIEACYDCAQACTAKSSSTRSPEIASGAGGRRGRLRSSVVSAAVTRPAERV